MADFLEEATQSKKPVILSEESTKPIFLVFHIFEYDTRECHPPQANAWDFPLIC
jgi:hypothetical protein